MIGQLTKGVNYFKKKYLIGPFCCKYFIFKHFALTNNSIQKLITNLRFFFSTAQFCEIKKCFILAQY